MMGIILLVQDSLFHASHIFAPNPVACLKLNVAHHLLPRARGLNQPQIT